MVKSSLFGLRKSEKFAKIIRIDTPENAMKSIEKMKEEFDGAATREKKEHVIKSLNAASNISKVMSGNQNITPIVRQQKKYISQMYRDAQKELSSKVDLR